MFTPKLPNRRTLIQVTLMNLVFVFLIANKTFANEKATAWLHLSTGNGFEYKSSAQRFAGFSSAQRWISGDFNGDGKSDLVNVYRARGRKATAWVHLSTGNGFEYKSSFGRLAGFSSSQRWISGDFNGDGMDDLVNVYGGPGNKATAWLHLSTGNGFEYKSSFQRLAGFSSSQRWISGDFNGDGMDDLVNVYGGPGNKATAWLHLSTGNGFKYKSSFQRFAEFSSSQRWISGDFNGDGKDDLVNVYRNHNEPIACEKNDIDLFEHDDPFNVLEMTLQADFNTVNNAASKTLAKSPGTLTYSDPTTGLPVSIDATVEARGKSRFDYCGWRPLRLRFNSDPSGTLLQGTGKVIKIVTHCGFKPGFQWILGGTPEEHTRRLLQENTLYKLLSIMGTTALDTRLTRIAYRNPNGTLLGFHYAFFREREKRAAERCGLERLESDEGDPSFPANLTSQFQARFHHKFLFSHDYNLNPEHNVVRMGSIDNREYYMPYDFDLTGVIRPEYFKNNNWSIAQNGAALTSWLSSQPNQTLVRVQIRALLDHETQMRQIIDASPVDSIGRMRLQAWFEDHIQRLKDFAN